MNWSNTAGLYCFVDGILGFRNDGAFLGNSDTSRKGCTGYAGSCTRHSSYNSTSRIPKTVVTNITRTSALTAVGTLHYWKNTVRLPEVTDTSLFSDRLWRPPSLLYDGYRVSFSSVLWLRRGVDYPPRCTVEVKEKVKLYCPTGTSWPAVG